MAEPAGFDEYDYPEQTVTATGDDGGDRRSSRGHHHQHDDSGKDGEGEHRNRSSSGVRRERDGDDGRETRERSREREEEGERRRRGGSGGFWLHDGRRRRGGSTGLWRHERRNEAGKEREWGRSRDREMREREFEWDPISRESRRSKETKEAEPEVDSERDQRTVFAFQIPLRATERDVYEFFTKAGKVRDVRLIMDRNARRSRGVGYIEFCDAISVPMAIALTGQLLLGQQVMVKASEAEKNLVPLISTTSSKKIYVGNLDANITDHMLRQVFESFGPVELVILPRESGSSQSKGYGFIQFAQEEHASAAHTMNGKLQIAGQYIKISCATDHVDAGTATMKAIDLDDADGGLTLNAHAKAMLMQKLDRTGTASSIMGSFGIFNEAIANQKAITMPLPGQTLSMAPAFSEPIGQPSKCILLKNMFDPNTETDPDFDFGIKEEVEEECSKFGQVKHIYVDKHSQGHVYMRFASVDSASNCQKAMHGRWYARRCVAALYVQVQEYEAKFNST